MTSHQPGILPGIPGHSRYLEFGLAPDTDPAPVLQDLASRAGGEGLMFVAFGHAFDAFEAQLARMTGQEDGIIDGLFRFTRPLTGSYFRCPPVADGELDLGAVGI